MRRLNVAIGLFAISATAFVSRAPSEVIAIAGSDGTTSHTWVEIKGDTYDQRAHFIAGVERLSAGLDHEIALLKAKRAGMTTDTKDWDFAMKEVEDSRSVLTSRTTELAKVNTPEAWVAARDGIGEAWSRSQLAVDKMNTTVTS
jgi:hypothetical protein